MQSISFIIAQTLYDLQLCDVPFNSVCVAIVSTVEVT
jgi:hypothetical protein